MHVTGLQIKNFRNFEQLEMEPTEGINIIYGENGQGKTNLVEAVWLFTGCRSFRTSKNNELIKEHAKEARIHMDIFAMERDQYMDLQIGSKKTVQINGVPQDTPRRLLGVFRSVVFSPDALSVVKDGPAERRRFLDIAISQIKPAYAALLAKYLKVLANRNMMLKNLKGEADLVLLETYDLQLAKLGAQVCDYRIEYLNMLTENAAEVYGKISQNREMLSLSYQPCGRVVQPEDYEGFIYEQLQKNRQMDFRRMTTSVGPHKDDINILLDQLPARSYGSQGQQRSCALAMKLAEADWIEKVTGERPIALLDDVMSELDSARQTYLLECLKGWQVFVTCCDPTHLRNAENAAAFYVEKGTVKKMEQI